MRYAAETEEVERDGPPEDASDWDSLSDRVRKARMKQKTLLQQHRGLYWFLVVISIILKNLLTIVNVIIHTSHFLLLFIFS